MNFNINRVIRNIIFVFILTNFIAILVITLLPSYATQSNSTFSLALNITFVFLVVLFSLLVYLIYPGKYKSFNTKIKISDSLLQKNIKVLITFPIIGILMMLFDRIVLRGIDYSQGLRYARYDWLSSTGGTPIGIMANLLIPFAYVSIYFLIVYWSRLERKQHYILIFSICVGVIGHAALNGGRSNLLLALVMIIIGLIFKKKSEKKFTFTFETILICIIFIFAMGYVGYIITLSAKLGDVSLVTLLDLGTKALYGEIDQEFYENEHSVIIYLLIYSLSYLYHGQWTAEVSSFVMLREGSYSIPPLLKSILGIYNEPTYFSETGAFISLPGAFYYGSGFLGLIGFSILLGILLGIVFIIIGYNKYISSLKMTYIIAILYILILSPILPAYGLSYYNFILFSFIMLSLLNGFFYKKTIKY